MLKTVIFSLIILILIHNILNYFKQLLTKPSVKDLINSTANQIEINNIIQQCESPQRDNPNMKEELKEYIESLSKDIIP